MIKLFRKMVIFLLPRSIGAELKVMRRFVEEYGHLKSVRSLSSIDIDRKCIPWYTYPAIEYLVQFDYGKKTVFEWGAGNSSIFWSKRAKHVVSIEDHSGWFDTIAKNKEKNNDIFLIQDKSKYVSKIAEYKNKFDIIVVDAKYRKECAEISGNHLKKGGLLIFDNSDRYPKLCKKIKRKFNLIQIDFHGFAPINSYTHTTSIFFDGSFNFKPIANQPMHSLGSLKEICE